MGRKKHKDVVEAPVEDEPVVETPEVEDDSGASDETEANDFGLESGGDEDDYTDFGDD
jgi:hypothetical protein